MEFQRSFHKLHFAWKPVVASRNVGCFLKKWGVLASTTATAAETSLLKWIRVFSNFSRLLQFAENVKCRRISLGLISWGPHYSSLEREREIGRRLFTFSIKREIRHFHVVVVQWRQRNKQKSVMHVQSCCSTHKSIASLTFAMPTPSSLLKLTNSSDKRLISVQVCHFKWVLREVRLLNLQSN